MVSCCIKNALIRTGKYMMPTGHVSVFGVQIKYVSLHWDTVNVLCEIFAFRGIREHSRLFA